MKQQIAIRMLLLSIVVMFMITLTSASLGSFDKNECVNIQTILNIQ